MFKEVGSSYLKSKSLHFIKLLMEALEQREGMY